MYLENDKYKHRNIEVIALFVTPGMQRRGTSRHVCIYNVRYLVIILESSLYCIFCFPLHFNKYVHKYFKHYYNDGNHLVLKYVFIYVSIGPLVLGHTIHRQRLCTLSKTIGV